MRDPGAEPRLVVPAGLVIDENVRERLTRELAHLQPEVAGVAAEIADLEPGASYRVHNEWLSLEASSPRPATSSVIRGAVLLRPHVEFVIHDGSVEVPGGSVVVDRGGQVHDPRRLIGPLQVASERGRPPFPRRPLVVFLACEQVADPDWLRRLVNRLVRHDVEARIAAPELAEAHDAPAVHLTRPSLAVEGTIRALAPDVVVTLDRAAAAAIDGWCSGDRSTVVVDFDAALPVPMELVSWQIGHAAGRLRARIGPWVDVPEFAALVVRLCAGPHPIPPADDVLTARAPVLEHWTTRTSTDTARRCVVLTGALDAGANARVVALVDNLEAAGVAVVVSRQGAGDAPGPAAAAHDAGLVVLAGVAPTPEIDALIAARRRAGLTTALDLVSPDLDPGDADPAHGGLVLSAAAAALSDACDLVTSAGGALHSAASRAGRRALVIPTLLTRERAAALRDARAPADPAGVLVIGWRIGMAGGEPDYSAAVAEGIARILTEHRDRVEIAGAAEQVPAALRGHERVTVVGGGDVDPEVIAHWAVHVWTPTLREGEIVDDARLLEEAGCAGVPSVMPAAATGGVDGYVSPYVLVQSVDRSDEWYDALHHVLDDPGVRARRAREATRRADALDGPAASKAVVSRLIGLASYPGERPGRAK